MKNENFIAVGLLLVIVISWFAMYDAKANENNNTIKMCIGAYDTWSNRSRCYHDWKVEDNERKYAEQREYTNMRPWYYGRNWKWEETAEYRCEIIYNNNLMQTLEICSKPIYIN